MNWWSARRTTRDVVRCLVGLHRPYLSGRDPVLGLVQRCSCGAFGPAPWVRLDPMVWWRR